MKKSVCKNVLNEALKDFVRIMVIRTINIENHKRKHYPFADAFQKMMR